MTQMKKPFNFAANSDQDYYLFTFFKLRLNEMWCRALAEVCALPFGLGSCNADLLSVLLLAFYFNSLLSSPMSTSYSTKQWAAVMTQRGEMMAPPQTCFPFQCKLTCQPHLPLAAIAPPTIRRPSLAWAVQSGGQRIVREMRIKIICEIMW